MMAGLLRFSTHEITFGSFAQATVYHYALAFFDLSRHTFGQRGFRLGRKHALAFRLKRLEFLSVFSHKKSVYGKPCEFLLFKHLRKMGLSASAYAGKKDYPCV
jgi:hypothetical protein